MAATILVQSYHILLFVFLLVVMKCKYLYLGLVALSVGARALKATKKRLYNNKKCSLIIWLVSVVGKMVE
jgi:hypothetical protein